MSSPDTQLGRLVAAMVAEAPAAPDFDAVWTYEPDPPRKHRFPALIAACAVVVAAILIAVFAIVGGDDGRDRATSAPATDLPAGSCYASLEGVSVCVGIDKPFALELSGLQPGSEFDLLLTAKDGSTRSGAPAGMQLRADEDGSFPPSGGVLGVAGIERVAEVKVTGTAATGRPFAITVPLDGGWPEPTTSTTTETSDVAQLSPCFALAGVGTAGGTINVRDVATQQAFAMSVAQFCQEAEALRPPQDAPIVMENYVANGHVQATYYRTSTIEQVQEDGSIAVLSSHEPIPISKVEAEAIIQQYRSSPSTP